MGNTYTVEPATHDHALHIGRHARRADVEELAAASGRTCLEALLDGLLRCDTPLTGLINGEPACMFGVVQTNRVYNIGAPWMIGTELLEQHALAFLRRSKPAFYPLAAQYSELVNYVDARHTAAIRWLKWLGFEFDEAKPHGVAGLPFHRFYMKA